MYILKTTSKILQICWNYFQKIKQKIQEKQNSDNRTFFI